MEEVTGLEILARMCALSPRPRVIVITARDDLAARATAMAIGPVAFFIKPFNDEQFLAAVHDALAQANTRSRKTKVQWTPAVRARHCLHDHPTLGA